MEKLAREAKQVLETHADLFSRVSCDEEWMKKTNKAVLQNFNDHKIALMAASEMNLREFCVVAYASPSLKQCAEFHGEILLRAWNNEQKLPRRERAPSLDEVCAAAKDLYQPIEIATSSYEVAETADEIEDAVIFGDTYGSFHNLKTADYPYLLLECKGPKYVDNWCEGRYNMMDEDTDISEVFESKTAAREARDRHTYEENKYAIQTLTVKIFGELDDFATRVVSCVFRTCQNECEPQDQQRILEIAQKYARHFYTDCEKHEEWNVWECVKDFNMIYSDWKKIICAMIGEFVDVFLEKVADQDTGAPQYKYCLRKRETTVRADIEQIYKKVVVDDEY